MITTGLLIALGFAVLLWRLAAWDAQFYREQADDVQNAARVLGRHNREGAKAIRDANHARMTEQFLPRKQA